jgi:hypothetical protein
MVSNLDLKESNLDVSCHNLQPAQIAGFTWISQMQNPKSIQEMGFYNSTMAISTGFTVGLNVNNWFFSIRFTISMSNNFK